MKPTVAPTEPERAFMDELWSATGRDFTQWCTLLAGCGRQHRNDLIKWLQDAQGLEYRTAHRLAQLYVERREAPAAIVHYTSEGRAGTVHYRSPAASFDLWYEFAGGAALAIIDIPTPEQWTARTNTPLSQRLEILQFIGEQVVKDQTHGLGSYTIGHDVLTIYSGPKP